MVFLETVTEHVHAVAGGDEPGGYKFEAPVLQTVDHGFGVEVLFLKTVLDDVHAGLGSGPGRLFCGSECHWCSPSLL